MCDLSGRDGTRVLHDRSVHSTPFIVHRDRELGACNVSHTRRPIWIDHILPILSCDINVIAVRRRISSEIDGRISVAPRLFKRSDLASYREIEEIRKPSTRAYWSWNTTTNVLERLAIIIQDAILWRESSRERTLNKKNWVESHSSNQIHPRLCRSDLFSITHGSSITTCNQHLFLVPC